MRQNGNFNKLSWHSHFMELGIQFIYLKLKFQFIYIPIHLFYSIVILDGIYSRIKNLCLSFSFSFSLLVCFTFCFYDLCVVCFVCKPAFLSERTGVALPQHPT